MCFAFALASLSSSDEQSSQANLDPPANLRGRTGLWSLPTEIRRMIWAEFGKTADFRNLLLVDKQTNAEVLSQIFPVSGVKFSDIPFGSRSFFGVEEVTVVVDGRCSGSYWLKIEVTYFKGASSFHFIISDVDSPSARFLSLFAPSKIVIEFRAPKGGHHLASLLTMRAKLYDALFVVERLLFTGPGPTGWFPSTEIRFWEDERRRCKSFWMNRARVVPRTNASCPSKAMEKEEKKRRRIRPVLFFYEVLLFPSITCNAYWSNAEVLFSCWPNRKQTSFATWFTGQLVPNGQNQRITKRHGTRNLVLTLWIVMDRIFRHMTNLGLGSWLKVPGHAERQEEAIRQAHLFNNEWNRWEGPLHKFMSLTKKFYDQLESFLHSTNGSNEAAQLRACIRRAQALGPNNAFSMNRPNIMNLTLVRNDNNSARYAISIYASWAVGSK
ncbi:hypothetical protein QBC44DRAFT_392444 [Cladorrhinum sp. PSN332]|nr:hypothetical protein QBC44DRAFT_392444 [Cladorrhinum sp. PSN332]